MEINEREFKPDPKKLTELLDIMKVNKDIEVKDDDLCERK